MQRSHCFNSSPTSVARDLHDDNLKSMAIKDDFTLERTLICSLNRCSSERANDKCVLKKRNDVKSALFSMNKELYIMEKDKVKCVDVVVQVSKPKQVVYTSALQAFIQQLVAEQTRISTVIEDPSFSMLPQRPQKPQLSENVNIPELQESYSSTDLTATENDDESYDDRRYDSISTLGDNDDDHAKYSDLPLLIDISHEMRSFM